MSSLPFPDDKKLQELIDNRPQVDRISINLRRNWIKKEIVRGLESIKSFPIHIQIELHTIYDFNAWDEIEAETKQHPPWKHFKMYRRRMRASDIDHNRVNAVDIGVLEIYDPNKNNVVV